MMMSAWHSQKTWGMLSFPGWRRPTQNLRCVYQKLSRVEKSATFGSLRFGGACAAHPGPTKATAKGRRREDAALKGRRYETQEVGPFGPVEPSGMHKPQMTGGARQGSASARRRRV